MELELKYEKNRDLYNVLKELGFRTEYNDFTVVRLKSYGAYELLAKIIDKPAEEIVIREEGQVSRVVTDFEGIKAVLYAVEMANTRINILKAKLENKVQEIDRLRDKLRELKSVIENVQRIVNNCLNYDDFEFLEECED